MRRRKARTGQKENNSLAFWHWRWRWHAICISFRLLRMHSFLAFLALFVVHEARHPCSVIVKRNVHIDSIYLDHL